MAYTVLAYIVMAYIAERVLAEEPLQVDGARADAADFAGSWRMTPQQWKQSVGFCASVWVHWFRRLRLYAHVLRTSDGYMFVCLIVYMLISVHVHQRGSCV